LAPAIIERRLDNCETAAKYQLFHAATLVGLVAIADSRRSRWWPIAAGLFTAGVAGFSGGLYLIVFAGTAVHWAIVPMGGLTLILGWLTLTVAALRSSPSGLAVGVSRAV
jgi:uncharacterized membrane protein YgdD (TMEM256/DUF423 family)